MKTRIRRIAVTSAALAGALVLASCSGSGTTSESSSGGGTQSGGAVDGAGKTLTVWSMTGDLSDATLKAINDEKGYPS